MNRPTFIVLTIFVFIFILYLINTYLIVQLSVISFDYVAIKDQTDQYKRKNLLLQEQILEKQSLVRIHEKAIGEGFVPAKYHYLYPSPTKAIDKESASESTSKNWVLDSPIRTAFVIVISFLLALLYRITANHPEYLPFYGIFAYMNKVRRKAKKHRR